MTVLHSQSNMFAIWKYFETSNQIVTQSVWNWSMDEYNVILFTFVFKIHGVVMKFKRRVYVF